MQIRIYKKSVTVGKVHKDDDKYTVLMKTPADVNCPFDDTLNVSCAVDGDGFNLPLLKRQRTNSLDDYSLYKSVKRTREKVFDYSHSNVWEWFGTLTFSPDKVSDRADYAECSKKMTSWLNNMRKRYCPDLKYILVPERHIDGSWHFHGLFSGCDGLCFKTALNGQKTLKNGKSNKYYMQPLVRDGRQVYDCSRYKLGHSDFTKVDDSKRVSNYILKYITKEMVFDVGNRKRYWCSQGLDVPQESIEFEQYNDYRKFVVDYFSNLQEKYPNAYCNTVEVMQENFNNTITYITC